jgi:hypothetical protein
MMLSPGGAVGNIPQPGRPFFAGVNSEMRGHFMAVEEASKSARTACHTPAALARIIGTPVDVYMFSRLPEADQKAILPHDRY